MVVTRPFCTGCFSKFGIQENPIIKYLYLQVYTNITMTVDRNIINWIAKSILFFDSYNANFYLVGFKGFLLLRYGKVFISKTSAFHIYTFHRCSVHYSHMFKYGLLYRWYQMESISMPNSILDFFASNKPSTGMKISSYKMRWQKCGM